MASTKTEAEADIYGDLYEDDDNEFAVAVQNGEETGNEEEQESVDYVEPTSLASSTAPLTSNQHPHGTMQLPLKPNQSNGSSTNNPSASSISYSAQIAKQFSQYQQTPSQERQGQQQQQRPSGPQSNGPLGPQPIQSFAGPSTIQTHEGPLSSAVRQDSSGVFGKKPSEMHDSGKLFIGGLNWDTTDEGLRDYFQQFGKVDACTIMRDPAGTSRGFAFLTFEDANAVNVVVTREHNLDGKMIDPKRAIPREEHLRNTRYFVGGLAPATTSDSMRAFFAIYGKVVDATVMVDRESGRSKGFGFVTFEDSTNADALVGKIGLTLDDKEIEVKMAQPRSQRDQTRAMTPGGTTPNRDPFFNDRDSRTPSTAAGMTPFINPAPNPMGLMYRNAAGMNPLMGGMMGGMNPMMAAMGMGMNGMGGMMNGMGGMMNGMGGMMGGMNPMNMGAMGLGAMNGMRMGMPGMAAQMGNMGNMGGMMRPGMPGINPNPAANPNSGGVGPARTNTRSQHGFHPYAR